MKKLRVVLAAVAALSVGAGSAPADEGLLDLGRETQATEPVAPLSQRVQSFLAASGSAYGLSVDEAGRLVYTRPDPISGKNASRVLDAAVSGRLSIFLSALPPGDPEPALASALRSFLDGRTGGVEGRLFAQNAGVETLTPTGRNVLMDILTAEDGLGFDGKIPQVKDPRRGLRALARLRDRGQFTIDDPKLATSLGGLFDGSKAGGPGLASAAPYRVGRFEWSTLAKADSKTDPLEGYSVNAQKKTVRVMVAANRGVSADHIVVQDAAEATEITSETGLDPKLLDSHGAKVVRAIDNLVMLDVPLDQVGALGQELDKRGIESRPARVVKMAAGALENGPAWPDPLFAALPIAPRGAFFTPEAEEPGTVHIMNAGSRTLMKVQALHDKGMTGGGSVVGIIDSGVDINHPDFKGRVAAFIDLSGDWMRDVVGHGTHVAGSVGGSGAASNGLYKGMAPDTKFVVVKVFGDSGSTSEDTILAAMAAVRNLPKEIRPQVVNMSLGGPGDPATDPLSVMANQMMVKDNILMAIAAGNEGPSDGTVGTPGSAKYVMTVTGVNHDGKFSFFPSRGPVKVGNSQYNKPDISTVAGDVNLNMQRRAFWSRLMHPFDSAENLGLHPNSADPGGAVPQDPKCEYGPGVISDRSSDDTETGCEVKGNPNYRFMSGTSMATPMAAGIAADVIGYLNEKERPYQATEVKALMMETADNLGQKPEVQGAGLVDGDKLSKALQSRVDQGLPVGNIAYMIEQRGGSKWQEFNLAKDGRFERTPLGLLDKQTGHLVNTDKDYDQVLAQTQKNYDHLPWYKKMSRKVDFWLHG